MELFFTIILVLAVIAHASWCIRAITMYLRGKYTFKKVILVTAGSTAIVYGIVGLVGVTAKYLGIY